MSWVPLIRYGEDDTILILTLQQRWWEPQEGVGFGDEDEADCGRPHSYVVRYDRGVRVTIRFTDDEYEDVMNFMQYAMTHKAEAFFYRFDQSDGTTEFNVYLEEPKLGARVQPRRDPGAPWVWELTLLLRNSAGERIHVPGALG